MAGSRYSLIQKAFWQYLGPAYRGLDADLSALEAATPGGGGSQVVTETSRVFDGLTASWEDGTDTVPYVMGTRWTAKKAGQVTGMRYQLTTRAYDGVQLTVALYPDTGPTALATATFTPTAGTALGWVDVDFASPVDATAGTVYKAAVTAPLQAGTAHYPNLGAEWTVYAQDSAAIGASSAGGNGWYAYNQAGITNPSSASGGGNMYGIDVNFVTQETFTTQPVVSTYYTDATAASAPRPTESLNTTVLWFNTDGQNLPANALAGVDKALTV